MTVSINGVKFLVLEERRGHEGETLITGEIVIGRKKIATYVEHNYGAGADTSFKGREQTELFVEKKNEYFEANPADDTSAEAFIGELIQLHFLKLEYEDNKLDGTPVTALFSFERRVTDTPDYPRKPTRYYGFDSVAEAEAFAEKEKPVTKIIVKKKDDLKITI